MGNAVATNCDKRHRLCNLGSGSGARDKREWRFVKLRYINSPDCVG